MTRERVTVGNRPRWRRQAWLIMLVAIAALAAASEDGAAQDDGPPASQHGRVSQTVNRTEITVEYDRPVARGREIFGALIEWDVVWTPGANRATWIELSTPVTLEGQPMDAGRYGIWMVPAETDGWEVVMVREWDTHHSFFPFESEALRVRVEALSGDHMETLAFYFPRVGPYETELRMHWADMYIPLAIEVPR